MCPASRAINRSVCPSIWTRGAPAQLGSTLSDQPQTGAGRLVPGHCARVRPWPSPYLFMSTVNTNLSSSPFPPPQRLLRNPSQLIASHFISSHHTIAQHGFVLLFTSHHEQSSLLITINQNTSHRPRNRATAPSSLTAASRAAETSHRRRHPSICSPPRHQPNSLIATASSPRLQSLPSRSRHSRACYIRTHLTTCTFRNSHHAVPAEAQG